MFCVVFGFRLFDVVGFDGAGFVLISFGGVLAGRVFWVFWCVGFGVFWFSVGAG